MNRSISHIIDSFRELDVLIIGEAMLDIYLQGVTNRLCREAPVPVITVTERKDLPGGAANTAVNVAHLGSRVTFLSVTGRDADSLLLKNSLKERGVSTEYLIEDRLRSTLTKNRVFADAQMLLRFDGGSVDKIGADAEERLVGLLQHFFPRCDALIVSDYGYGVLTPRLLQVIEQLQRATPRIVVVDSKHPEMYRSIGVTAAKPNYGETVKLLGIGKLERVNDRVSQISKYEETILSITGAQIAAVTLDCEGAVIFERGTPAYRTYARPAANCRATGAGDTFVSAFTVALAAGANTPAAAELASAAASIVVAKDGTSSCSAAELLGYVSSGDKVIKDTACLSALASFYHQQRQKIVFTNGCFDILHRGHITYLSRAKALGEVLIVGVNSDDSIRRLKGTGRPINVLEDRMQVLTAMSCVDHVIGFDGDTSEEIIRVLHPDLFVKGGDYTRATLPEAPLVESLGGKVHFLPYLEEKSTTGIIERIRREDPETTEAFAGKEEQ